ncbi:acetyl-CoA carboxylase biotin carboxylase subunit family protein [Streptomyces sp. NWU49]|uniref:ATP-grasp domain-containing protein n=1 Tax=Streptomyces sp. NWU49 TaxID=2201153 RepID=UPI0015E7FE4A|nr:ATP-grasp domain-containing protein [Streptomyces sp. NWU49]
MNIHLVTRSHGGVPGHDHDRIAHIATFDVRNSDHVRSFCEWTLRNHPITHVLALHEKAVLPAAELRTQFGLDGMDLETAMRFRDKVTMKQVIRDADAAPVPEFSKLDGPDDLTALNWGTGRKVIKSRVGLGASEVHIVEDIESARAVCSTLDLTGSTYEIEEFVAGEIYHCDAIMQNGTIRFASVAKYIANPASYAPGGFFGTVLLSEGELFHRITDLNAKALSALGLQDGVTHLELFHTPDDELIFCEVAGRPAGGVIPPVLEWHFGINIFEESLRLQAGLPLSFPRPNQQRSGTCGFVAFYPDGRPNGHVGTEEQAALGVLEHSRHSSAGDGSGGVRHSTDFQDSYVIEAPDQEALMQRIEEVKRIYTGSRSN